MRKLWWEGLLHDTDFELRWSDEEDGFRCVLRPAPKPWDALGDVIEVPMSTGAKMPVTALTVFIAIAMFTLWIGLALAATPLDLELGYPWLAALLGVGIALRLVLGFLFLPDTQDWIATLNRGQFTLLKGSHEVFTSGLDDLSAHADGSTIHLSGARELTLQTGVSAEGVERLTHELAQRAKAYGSPRDVPRALLLGADRQRC